MAGGALTLFTCYCLPTAACVGIYGLIVYLNPEVVEAFGLGEMGYRPSEILAAFRLDPHLRPTSPFAASAEAFPVEPDKGTNP